MRALTYHGAHSVKVDNVPDPVIQDSDDIILRVTATAICGSDLHLYRGKIPTVEHGDIFGHEFTGIVEEAGSAVTAVQPGDRVVIPFVIACGSCFFCAMDLFMSHRWVFDSGQGLIGRDEIFPVPTCLSPLYLTTIARSDGNGGR